MKTINIIRIGCYPSLRFLFSLFSAVVTTVEQSEKAKLHIEVAMGKDKVDKINKDQKAPTTGKMKKAKKKYCEIPN